MARSTLALSPSARLRLFMGMGCMVEMVDAIISISSSEGDGSDSGHHVYHYRAASRHETALWGRTSTHMVLSGKPIPNHARRRFSCSHSGKNRAKVGFLS